MGTAVVVAGAAGVLGVLGALLSCAMADAFSKAAAHTIEMRRRDIGEVDKCKMRNEKAE